MGVRKDGKKINVSLTISPIFKHDSNRILGVSTITRDITEHKQLESRQNELLQEFENINQELDDFARIVSHDLKAPLRGINTLAEYLSIEYRDQFDDKGKEFLRLLDQRARLMSALIDGILEYSQVGYLKEKLELTDLNNIVKKTVDIIAPPNNIRIHIEGKLPSIRCTKIRVQQVFQNLLGNAVKYMDKEKGEVKVACVPDGDFWKFSVSDNGPGIKEKYFRKIFQMFQTLQPKTKSQSSGIGLALAKKIVEVYGGKIWVESKEGKGSAFFFTLPKNHA